MGLCCSSPRHLLEGLADGDEEDYHRSYLQDTKVLGEGEFGVVHVVRNVQTNTDVACKILRKGAVFKDNILYAPMQPAVLRAEVRMLKLLRHKDYCLQLHAVYEGPSRLYLVTELCAGGDVMEWVAAQPSDLTVDTVARIARELCTAVDHCYQHKILHRDIKPQNLMFVSKDMSSAIRVIDFGSGCIDSTSKAAGEGDAQKKQREVVNGHQTHTTFAGTGFFMAPEIFHEPYTILVDIWSAAVSLYVLVAGYPSQELQRAFNILQKADRNLRDLPGHNADALTDAYFDFLTQALTYHYRSRPTAHDLLQHPFLQVAPSTPTPEQPAHRRPQEISGSVQRHSVFLDFRKYERSLTALLAAMLSRAELRQLVEPPTDQQPSSASKAHLSVLPCKDLIQKATRIQPIVYDTIQQLPNAALYGNFAYHMELLKEFTTDHSNDPMFESRSNRSLSLRRFSLHKSRSSPHLARSVHGTTKSKGILAASTNKPAVVESLEF